MSTVTRPELSKKNEYYISKQRYYELKYFCLQYSEWKKAMLSLETLNFGGCIPEFITSKNHKSSPVERIVIAREYYQNKIDMVDECAKLADDEIFEFIILGVTKELSCTTLINSYDMPCGKDKYYKAYRKFFWYLSTKRH